MTALSEALFVVVDGMSYEARLEAEIDRLGTELNRRDQIVAALRGELRAALSDAREASDALMLGSSGKAYASLREVCRRLHEAGRGEA